MGRMILILPMLLLSCTVLGGVVDYRDKLYSCESEGNLARHDSQQRLCPHASAVVVEMISKDL
jgi:hypothetical protein